MNKAKLYIVPTPIGNLSDMTFRAVETLKSVDLILAEDTRKTGILLKHFDISRPMFSYHKFNEHKILETIISRLKAGESAALVSDAGTPGISDPGFLVTREALANEIEVECLPGATAFIPALVNSGLPNDRFVFEGFLPRKKGRNKRLAELAEENKTIILYESPFRLAKTLAELAEVLGPDRNASVSRELTKLHEENTRGTLKTLSSEFEQRKNLKGELVIIVEGRSK